MVGRSERRKSAVFAGILHDLGKYGTRFQARLRGTETHIDHWSAGALEAALAGQSGFAAALAIQGHHIGLQRGDRDSLAGLNIANLLKSHPLACSLSDDDHAAIKRRAQAEGFCWNAPPASCFDWAMRGPDPVGQMLAVRMLFSALVDADFIATERHFQGLATSGQRRDTFGLGCGRGSCFSPLVHRQVIKEQQSCRRSERSSPRASRNLP